MQTYESIRTRLQGQAAGRFNCRPENLPPETRLLIDWMAWELGALHRDLSRSNDTIVHRLQQRLRPDTQTRPLPAHALAYAQPRQNGYTLRPDADVFHLPRFAPEAPHQLFFAPLLPVSLVKAKVKYIASGSTLSAMDEPFKTRAIGSAQSGTALHPGMLWVGIQLDTPLTAGQTLCFYINWDLGNAARREVLSRLLPLVEWRKDDCALQTRIGLLYDQPGAERHHSAFVDEEFMFLYGIEKNILEQYQAQFVQVDLPAGQQTGAPADVREIFQAKGSEELPEAPLFWLKLVFPAGFKPEEIQQTALQLNCFPVLNRCLDKTRDFTPTEQGSVEIRSLSNAGQGRAALAEIGAYFLGIQRIFTQNANYRPVNFGNFPEAPRGAYALQHGRVEAGDLRDVYGRIAELSQLIREHSSTLLLLEQHGLNQALDQIENGAGLLQNALNQAPAKDLDLGYYLHLKALDPQDLIFVRFWITQGEYARNAGTPGDMLPAERNNTLEGDAIWWVGERI